MTKKKRLLLWRVAKDTFYRKYPPNKIKERVEAGLYHFGLLALLLLLFIGLVALFAVLFLYAVKLSHVDGGVSSPILPFVLQWIGALPEKLMQYGKDFYAIESSVFILLLYVTAGFFFSVMAAWRRHVFEAAFTSPEFRDFMKKKLALIFDEALFARKRGEYVPMAPISIAGEFTVNLNQQNFHALLPSAGLMAWRHRILKYGTVRWPDRIGFSAVKVDLSFSKVEVQTCRYQEDLDTAYTLGYAYYVWFLRSRSSLFKLLGAPVHLRRFQAKVEDWRKNASLRGDKISRNDLPFFLSECVFVGDWSVRTQLGVQAIVIFNDYSDGGTWQKPKWKVVLQKRSDDVASSPNHFQFIPSGGFESHQTYSGGTFDSFEQSLLAHECDIERGLLREFAEEVLGVSEFMDNESLDPDDVYREPGIKSLRDLFVKKEDWDARTEQQGRATLQLLGAALSLIGFKAEISYALIIDHPDYFVKHRLQRSKGEARLIFTWELDMLGKLLSSEEHPMVDSSITMLKLFLDDEVLHKLLNYAPDDTINKLVKPE